MGYGFSDINQGVLKTPFFWRLVSAFVFLSLGTLLLTSWISSYSLRQAILNQEFAALERFMLHAVATLPGQYRLKSGTADNFMRSFDEAGYWRLSVLDAEGRVLADNMGLANGDRVGSRPQHLPDHPGGISTYRVFEQSPGAMFHYYTVQLTAPSGEIESYFRGGVNLTDLDQQISKELGPLYTNLKFLGGALVVTGALFALLLAIPVQKITVLAETISRGDFDRRLPVNRVGLSRLANAINQLARTSAERVALVTADRNRLATIFGGMTEGVIDVDQRMYIQHINDAAAKLLDLNPASSVNRPIWEQVRIPGINAALDQAMNSREVVKSQLRLQRERDELVVDIHAASLSNESGEPLGAVIVLNDISELETLSRVRTDFVANASHELKTPITAIRGLAETMLSDDQISPGEGRRFMKRIHAQSLRLSQLVSDLMAISRLESIQHDQSFCRVSMAQIVNQSVQSFRSAADARDITLDVFLPGSDLFVLGDRHNLSQLADNLLDNALKYTPVGGQVCVSLEARDGFTVFCVADTGIGISHQYQQRIFERFYRVDKVRSQSLGGTGLGLSIVKNIVEKHQGEITLKSQLGSGSVFTVRLPLDDESEF